MTTTDTRPQVALVTGANKGIGRAIARGLGARGFVVYLGARSEERGRAAEADLRGEGLDVRFVRLDVTDDDDVAAAADRIATDFGYLSSLVNNAGTHHEWKTPSSTPVSELEDYLATNVAGVARVTGAALPLLRAASLARIVNISSVQGSLTAASTNHDPSGIFPDGQFPVILSHSTSKAAVNSMTLMYANELRDEGILVNAVCPGYVATDATDHLGPLTPEQGAVVPIRMATLDTDGPTGTFHSSDASGTGHPLPW